MIRRILLLLFPATLVASQTCIVGPVYRADGTFATGTLTISWPTFRTNDGKFHPAGYIHAPVQNGRLRVCLVPSSQVPGGMNYLVRHSYVQGESKTEYWSVPESPPEVNIADVVTYGPLNPVFPLSVPMGGTGQSGFVPGSVLFMGPSTIMGDFADFRYDDTTNILRVRIADLGGERFNVKAYGAAGNGTTDDTAAIQAAIDAAGAGEVYFPRGVYRITAPLVVSNHTVLVGENQETTVILNASVTQGAVRFALSGMTGRPTRAAGIRDLTIAAGAVNSNAANATAGDGIQVEGANYAFEAVRFTVRNHAVGVRLQDSSYVTLSDFNVTAFASAGVVIVGDSHAGQRLHRFVITNAGATGVQSGATGVQVLSTNGVTMWDGTVSSTPIGIAVVPGVGKQANYGVFWSVKVESCTTRGVWLDASAANSSIVSMHFIGSTVSYSGWDGSNWSASPGIQVGPVGTGSVINSVAWQGGRIRENGGHGAVLAGGTNVVIQGVEVASNGRAAANLYSGIAVAGASGRLLLKGNRIGNYSSTASQQAYAVALSAAVEGLVLLGNDLSGNVSGAVQWGTTPSAVSAYNNLGIDDSIPTLSASSSITVGPSPAYKITGTTPITTINGGWSGRQLILVFPEGGSLATGGNIAKSANVPIGAVVTLLYDGSTWFVSAVGDGSGGPGDITAVGNCASGDCFQSVPQNTIFAGPASGSGQAAFRQLLEGDIPATFVKGANALDEPGRIAYIASAGTLGKAAGLTWTGTQLVVDTSGNAGPWFRNGTGVTNYDLSLGRLTSPNTPLYQIQTSDVEGTFGNMLRFRSARDSMDFSFARSSSLGTFDGVKITGTSVGGTDISIFGNDLDTSNARLISCSRMTNGIGNGCWFLGSRPDLGWNLRDQGQNVRFYSNWAFNRQSIGGEDSTSTLTVVDPVPSSIGSVTFTGSGVNDLSVGGEYTGAENRTYCVRIDGVSPDRYRWGRDNCATWVQTGIDVNFSPVELEDGITIDFNVSTGHALNDTWTFPVTAGGITRLAVRAGVSNQRSSALLEAFSRMGDRLFAALNGDGLVSWTAAGSAGGSGMVWLSSSQNRGAVRFYDNGSVQRAFLGADFDSALFWSLRTTDSVPLSFGTNNQERMRILAGGDVEIRTRAVIGNGGPALVGVGSNIEVRMNDGSALSRIKGGSVTETDHYVPYGGIGAPSDGCAAWSNGKLVSTGAACGSGGGGGGGGQSKTFSTPSTTWTWQSSEHGLTTCDLVWEAYTLDGSQHIWTQGMSSYSCNGGNITVTWPVATAGKLVIGTGGSSSGSGGMPPPGSAGIVVWDGSSSLARSIAGTSGKIVVSNATGVAGDPTINIGSDVVDKTVANTFSAGAKQTFQPSSSTAGVNVACAALPSNPQVGDIACDSADSNRLKQFANGVWNTLGGASSGGGGSGFDPSQTYDLSGNNKVNMAYSSFYLQNDTTTGTALYRTVCLTSLGQAVQCSSGNYQRAIGICMEGCGTTGNARVGVMGKLTCDFDGSVTAGNWVAASASQPGKCTDAGTSKPAIPLGIVLVSQVNPGSYDIVRGIQ